jgi:hypothetical protein
VASSGGVPRAGLGAHRDRRLNGRPATSANAHSLNEHMESGQWT